MKQTNVKPATGRLGIMVVGCGAVSTTFMTGVLMARKGLAKPIGSMTQYDKIRVGKGANKQYLHYSDIVPLAKLDDIVFGTWDVYPQNAYQAAVYAEVLKAKDIEPVREELEAIVPMKAAFDKNYAKRLDGDNVKDCKTRWNMVEALRRDIAGFKQAHNCDRIVVIWAASTEIYVPYDELYHGSLAALEKAMHEDDRKHVAPSMCYAYAALAEGAPFIMGAPNTTVDIPAMWEMAKKTKMPIAGKDFKTGQTLVKSGFAPIIGTRCLGLSGWFSTNILGNRDGLVLDEPENFHTKEVSKLSTLETILKADEQPDLYGNIYHKVRINYYPPRNDDKEGWDNIDIYGWMGYPMQIKINFLCRDSILAAPLLLDLCLLSDLAARAGRYGIQRFLSFYLKSPMHDYTKNEEAVNNLFQQYTMLKNAIRDMGGYELMRKLIKIIIIMLMSWAATANVVAQDIICFVVDQQTGDTIPYTSAVYKSTKESAVGSEAGSFRIARHEGMSLTVSAVGYKPRTVKINEKTPEVLRVSLIADSKRMQEVVVKAKRRHKYTRKNNPAVELMKRVIAAKKRTHLENHEYYQFDKYQKITIGANNLTQEELEGKLFQKSPWLRNQVEICPYNNKLILPISVDETLTQHLYRKEPRDTKDIILGQSTKGVSKLVQTGEIVNTVVKDLFKDIDLYDDQIDLLQQHFPSPIGSTAISFYHFYIDDTLYVNQDQCIRLQFMPANQQDFGFRGELYILNDSTLHVKKCDMQLPANTGVNFVDAMKIEQEFSKLSNGDWAQTKDNMIVELAITDLFSRAIVIRTTHMSNYRFDEIPPDKFKGKAKVKYNADSKMKDDTFWADHRGVELTKSEANMDNFITQISNTKHFKWVMLGIKVLAENFLETAPHGKPNKFDIGPVNTFISQNFVDGLRLRASGRTTAKLNPHWFGEGYYAYGFKSRKNYYGAKVTYSFNKPEYLPLEFPIRTISFESTFDVMAYSDRFLQHNKDNIFMVLRPKKTEKMFFYNRQTLNFKWETEAGLAMNINLKTESNEPTGGVLEYHKLCDGSLVNKIRMTELKIGLDYRPGQSYVNSKQNRIEVNLNAPRFVLNHTFGLKHFLGGEYDYHLTEASIYKRFWLGSWGNIDTRIMAGAQWSKVPYPMLIMPPVNTSYFEHQGTFNMMEDMEFLNDRYAMFNLAWDMKGKIFNRIPLLKKLKWREYIAFKGIWGHLTDKNNPLLAKNADDPDLYRFPSNTHVMNHEPYMELVVGVHNIFKCLEIDYVRRLTYTAYPGVDVNGVRLGFNIVF